MTVQLPSRSRCGGRHPGWPTFAVLVNAFVTRISRAVGVVHSLRNTSGARQRLNGDHRNMLLSAGQRVVFIGDSITDCDRRGAAAPYGDGYVDLVRSLVTARHPELGLSWVNRGIGGDTIRDLAARWDADAIGT